MTSRMIENRVRKIRTLEQRRAKLDEQIEHTKGELIAEMARKKTESIETTSGAVARYQRILTKRFDGMKFKKDLPAIYEQYLTDTVSHRFTCKLAEE